MSEEIDNSIALLISNTKRHKRNRSIPEIAAAIDVCVEHYGNISEVSENVGLSHTMLRQFLSYSKLDPQVQKYFAERTLDSVDVCAQLASLENLDQIKLSKELISGNINSKDIRDIRELRRKDSKSSLNTLVQRVKESNPSKEYVYEFILRGGLTEENAKTILTSELPVGSVQNLDFNGLLARLVLTTEGHKSLKAKARQYEVTLDQIIPEVLKTRNSLDATK